MNGFVVSSDGVVQDYDEWADTEFGPQFQQQAWSDGEQPFEPQPYRERHRWVTTLAGAGLAVALGALVAAIVLLTTGASKTNDDHNRWPDGYTNPTPAAQAPTSPEVPPLPLPPFVAPTEIAMVETQDGRFLQMLRAGNIEWTAGNETAIAEGHQTCSYMRVLRISREQMALWIYRNHQGSPLGIAEARAYVNACVTVYCPELA